MCLWSALLSQTIDYSMSNGSWVMGQEVGIGLMGQGVGVTGYGLYCRGHETGS